MVTGLRTAKARVGVDVRRAGARADELHWALKTLPGIADRMAAEALELVAARKAARAADVR